VPDSNSAEIGKGIVADMTPEIPTGRWIESDVPPRLDALGWSRWHRRVIIALGITWILDGLEASLISNLGPTLEFFVASAAASSAYLTVSELFPVEIRGMAIAVFFAFATLVGAAAPALFGKIVDSKSSAALFAGYALAAGLMIAAAVIARWQIARGACGDGG